MPKARVILIAGSNHLKGSYPPLDPCDIAEECVTRSNLVNLSYGTRAKSIHICPGGDELTPRAGSEGDNPEATTISIGNCVCCDIHSFPVSLSWLTDDARLISAYASPGASATQTMHAW